MCLPSDALLQHLPSYFCFSFLGCGVSLHGCSSNAQPLLLTLEEGYLLTAAFPDLQRGIAPLGPPAPAQPPLLYVLLFRLGTSLLFYVQGLVTLLFFKENLVPGSLVFPSDSIKRALSCNTLLCLCSTHLNKSSTHFLCLHFSFLSIRNFPSLLSDISSMPSH